MGTKLQRKTEKVFPTNNSSLNVKTIIVGVRLVRFLIVPYVQTTAARVTCMNNSVRFVRFIIVSYVQTQQLVLHVLITQYYLIQRTAAPDAWYLLPKMQL